VLVFVQPFLGVLWKFLLSNIKTFSDKICFDAALDNVEKYGFMAETRAAAFLIGSTFALMILAYSYPREPKGRFRLRLPFERVTLRLGTSRVFTTAFFIVSILMVTLGTAHHYLVMQMRLSFRQRLAVLAPKISDQEHKDFLAAWASMKNQEDYRKLVTDMKAEAKRTGVALPKLLPGATPTE
jgi:hypothetical protein